MKHLDQDMLHILQKLLQVNGAIEMPAKGCSMFPVIQHGDICSFISVAESEFAKGEILLFVTKDQQVIAHRFIRAFYDKGQKMVVCKGDSNLLCDEPIDLSRVIGKLNFIRKRKWRVAMNGKLMLIWGRCVISIPMLSKLLNRLARS